MNISYMINETLGYVKLSKFSRDANVLIEDAIRKLKKKGAASAAGSADSVAVDLDFSPPQLAMRKKDPANNKCGNFISIVDFG